MSDLVLLKCDIGSKAATVLCPECGRVSRQILSASYSPNRLGLTLAPYVRPYIEIAMQAKQETGRLLLRAIIAMQISIISLLRIAMYPSRPLK